MQRRTLRKVRHVLRIGLTGGIGAGKSSVARLLAGRGAVVVDADALAREVVAPGTPGLAAVVQALGPEVLADDGSLDRTRVAALVFADPSARQRLEGVVHPLVRRRGAELEAAAGPDAVVVHDIPLLVENRLSAGFDLVVVVEAAERLRLERLAARGLPVEQARARMQAQANDDERRAVADAVVRNDGDEAALAAAVDRLWVEVVEPARRRPA